MNTIPGFVNFLGHVVGALPVCEQIALEECAQKVEEKIKEVIGTYEWGWEELKQSTIDRKQTGDSPLLETGELQGSFEHQTAARVAYVGTNDPIAKYHEYGTDKMAARPMVGEAVVHMADEVHSIVGNRVYHTMLTAQP